MFRSLLLLMSVAVLSACGGTNQTLPRRVTAVSIQVEHQEPVVIDWASAREIAASDGFPVQPVPQTSPRPTDEEMAAYNAAIAQNRAYTDYVKRSGVLKRAEARVLPELE